VTRTARLACALLLLLVAALAACSDDDGGGGGGGSSARSSTTRPVETTTTKPSGPAADLSTELTGGEGVSIATADPDVLEEAGYVQREYAAEGTATSYKETGERTKDGRWTFTPAEKAHYRTRVLVRAPKRASDFGGTVMVEWLNVSGGVDAEPEWTNEYEEIERSGAVWVGVSAQRIGVEGGPVAVSVSGVPGADVAGKGLKKIDPVRYGSLEHPGDGFAFDIMTQVARALRGGAGLDGLQPKHVIAAGESQSAFALVTYYNGVQPLVHAFDGFFIHSRGGSGMPLVEPGKYADIAGALGGTATIFRTDQDTPVMDVQTETDVTSVIGSYAARQDDSDTFRLWEVAGTAHADTRLVGSAAKYLDCGVPINDGVMHIVAKAALRALVTWVSTGKAPRTAPRLDVTDGATGPTQQRDGDAIALGGIRTPPLDVPVSALSGASGPEPSTICLLLGSDTPFTAARIAELYPSRADYERRFEQAVDATIRAGFALKEDRAALLAFAKPDQVPA
jgi:hypothetical protein